MKLRTVKALQYADMVDMGGMPVRQPLPTKRMDMVDPFLLLHHHSGLIEQDSHPREIGVGPHPHRGFSPVTFILKGDVHHRDSRGNSSVVKAGGVQWMNAGMGVMHSERPSLAFAQSGGEQEIIQLWINTPHVHKMEQPVYIALQKEDIPVAKPDSGNGAISVIAGSLKGRTGPVHPWSEQLILRADLQAGAVISFPVDESFNALLYIISGTIGLRAYGPVEPLHMVVLRNDGDTIEVKAETDTTFLLLAGKPLQEKVAKYGPFVMTDQTEILEAMRDYQMGKMGILIEEFDS